MAILRIPVEVVCSPQDGAQVKLDTEKGEFFDEAGNKFAVRDLAPGRPASRIKKWLNENYPGSFTKWWQKVREQMGDEDGESTGGSHE